MKNNMVKKGTTIKDKHGYYIVDDIDAPERLAIIRKIMFDKNGNVYYGKRRIVGLPFESFTIVS